MDSPGFILYFIMKAIFKKEEGRGVIGRGKKVRRKEKKEQEEKKEEEENRRSNTDFNPESIGL